MDENKEFIPSLTLDPNAASAASADNGEAAQQLSRLLHYGQKPWLNSDY